MSLRLRRIVLTRPAGQNETLAAQIRAAGGAPWIFPLLEIAPTDRPAALAQCIEGLRDYAIAIFVSPNAVRYALPPVLQRYGRWPAGLTAATVGPGSAAALQQHGVQQVLAPSDRFDSESLLALMSQQNMNAKRVLIFRGQGGREVLAEGLRAQGAQVDYAECYRRSRPQSDAAALAQAAARNEIDALIITSSEALRNLHFMLQPRPAQPLLQLPMFVPHARIADNARRIGHTDIHTTAPGDAGLWSALQSF